MVSINPKALDEWRVVPRLLVGLYGLAFWRMSEWFMTLSEPNAAQAAFVSAMIGAAAAFFGLYVNSGDKT